MQKAQITTIPFGNLAIEGLLLPESTPDKPVFGVALVQAGVLFSYHHNHQNRDFKRILGERFAITKIATELDNRKIAVLPLVVFEALTFELAMRGNIKAQEFVRGLFGLSLHQLFCDAFSLKFEREDRQLWLRERQDGKLARREYTDMIKALIDAGQEINYGWLTLSLYSAIGILGQYKQWKNDENAQEYTKETRTGFRDTLDWETLRIIKEAELHVTCSVEDHGLALESAFELASKRYNQKTV